MGELLNGTQNGPEKKRMTDEAMMNMVCDDLAGGTTKAALKGGGPRGHRLLDLPYVGSKAMLKT